MRNDQRKTSEMRKPHMRRHYTKFSAGSTLISVGDTKVICTASVEEKVPPFLRNKNQGWVTAEYSLLPGATQERVAREASRGKQSGRTQEIQRLIGRSLRSIVDLGMLGARTIWIDCDVIQADGGTRTAAVSGAMVALWDAVRKLLRAKLIQENPIREFLAAISVGIVGGEVYLDLSYEEDSRADVDMNIVMTESGRFVELQGTAEHKPFDGQMLAKMLEYGQKGIAELIRSQKAVLKV